MTADDLRELEKMFDRKLAPITEKVDSHERDIWSVKVILGFFAALGGTILVLAAGISIYEHFTSH